MRSLLVIALTLVGLAVAQDAVVRGSVAGADGEVPIRWHGEGVTPAAGDDAMIVAFAAEAGRVRLRSEAFALPGGRLWNLRLEARRLPGLGTDWYVERRDGDQWVRHRGLIWQLSDCPRPGHIPLAPYRETYVQSFAALAAGEFRLAVELKPHPDIAQYRLEVFALALRPGRELSGGEARGPELFPAGAMLPGGEDGMPVGWGRWANSPPMGLVEEHGQTFLRLAEAGHTYLPSNILVPVERGAVYELSFRIRGRASLSLIGHALATQQFHPVNPRIGDAQAHGYEVDSDTWQEHRQLWVAEAIHLDWLQPWFSIHARGQLDIDDLSVRRLR